MIGVFRREVERHARGPLRLVADDSALDAPRGTKMNGALGGLGRGVDDPQPLAPSASEVTWIALSPSRGKAGSRARPASSVIARISGSIVRGGNS